MEFRNFFLIKVGDEIFCLVVDVVLVSESYIVLFFIVNVFILGNVFRFFDELFLLFILSFFLFLSLELKLIRM